MKTTLLLALLIILLFPIKVRGQEDLRSLYQHKIESYTKTKNAGSILLVTGGILSVVGGSVFITSLNQVTSTESEIQAAENRATLGAYAMGLGLDMIIGGAILSSVGNRKVRQYREKLNNLSAGLQISPQSRGFTLTYRF